MALLWVKVARQYDDDEDESYGDYIRSGRDKSHDDHVMHPAFEAAGLKHAPCAFTRCNDFDQDHSDAFDEAEERFFNGEHKPGTIDLTKPVYGFEKTCDMHTLRRYTKHPESRKGDPTIFIHRGKQYAFNGHHGISGALRRGETSMPGGIVNLDQEP